MEKKFKLKKWLFTFSSIGGVSIASAVMLTSCGVSKSVLDNMVDKFSGKGNFSNNLSFDQVVAQSAINKAGNTAFKNAIADDIALNFYQNAADGKYNNINKGVFQDNLTKWKKQVDDAYKAKIKDYKSNHKYDWPYYFQNEVLDPVGGTEENWRLYDSQSGLCQYVIKDLLSEAKKNDFLAIPKKDTIDDNYEYHWDQDVEINLPITDDNTHTFLNANEKLDPKYWNYINFFVKAFREPSSGLLDEFYVALQREAFYEWLNNYQPISSSNVFWKYSAPTTPNHDLKDIYNTSETDPNYAFPYFDDIEWNGESNKPANYVFNDMYNAPNDNGFSGSNPKYFLWDTNGYTTNGLGLINIDTRYNDSDASTMSLMSTDKYSSFSEFNGPAIYGLWNAFVANATTQNGHVKGGRGTAGLLNAKELRTNLTSTSTDPRILSNFLYTTSDVKPATVTDLTDLLTWYGGYDNAPDICKIYNNTSGDKNEIKNFNLTLNSFQLLKDNTNPADVLPYIMYRGDDGVHLVGLDGKDYLTAPDTSDFIGNNGAVNNEFVKTNKQYSRVRENALLKFRALYEKVSNPDNGGVGAPAGLGLKIQDAFKAYMDSNFASILINTYYRTSSTITNRPDIAWFGNHNDKDDVIDWKFGSQDIKNINQIWLYLNAANRFFDLQDLISKYDDANKKLIAFGQKYAGNLNGSNSDAMHKNALALALPWNLNSGKINTTGLGSREKIVELQSYYDENVRLLDHGKNDLPNDFNLQGLQSDTLNEFNIWKSQTDDVKFNDSKSKYMKYSEHIYAKNHYVADMMWAALSDSSGKISNLQRYTMFDAYLDPNKTGHYDIEDGDFKDSILGQYISSKLMSDSNSLPSYANMNDSDTQITFDDYKSLLRDRWNAKAIKDVSWLDHTSSDYISYLNFLAKLQYLSQNNCEKFMSYLQGKPGLNSSNPTAMLNSPSIIAWKDGDNFNDSATPYDNAMAKSDYKFRDNFFNQFDNRYTNTNIPDDFGYDRRKTGGMSAYNEYWQFVPFKKTSTDVTTLNGMGFIGLQRKGDLSGLPQSAADQIFDHLNTATDGADVRHGSLYRFGSTTQNVRNNIAQLLTTSNFNSLLTFLNNALPIDFAAQTTNNGTKIWANLYNEISDPTMPLQTKVDRLNDFLLHPALSPSSDSDIALGALYHDPRFTDNPSITDNLIKPYNCTVGSNGDFVFEPLNAQSGTRTRVFNDDKSSQANFIGFKIAAMQVNYEDVSSWDKFKGAVGEEVARAILVKTAMTSNTTLDIDVSKEVIKAWDAVFGYASDKKLDVYDRRFNDDADLKNWLQDYKSSN